MFTHNKKVSELAYVAADQQMVAMYSDFFYVLATILTGIAVLFYWSYTHYFVQRLTMLSQYRQANKEAKKAYNDVLLSQQFFSDHRYHLTHADHFYILTIENRIKLYHSLNDLNDTFEALSVYLTKSEYLTLLPIFKRVSEVYNNTNLDIPEHEFESAENAQSEAMLKLDQVGFLQSAINRIMDSNCEKRRGNAYRP